MSTANTVVSDNDEGGFQIEAGLVSRFPEGERCIGHKKEWNDDIQGNLESDEDSLTHDSSNQFCQQSTGTLSDNDDSNSQATSIDLAVYSQQQVVIPANVYDEIHLSTASNSNITTNTGDNQDTATMGVSTSSHEYCDENNKPSPSLFQKVINIADQNNQNKIVSSNKENHNISDSRAMNRGKSSCQGSVKDPSTSTATATASTQSPTELFLLSSQQMENSQHYNISKHDNSDSCDDILHRIHSDENKICAVLGIDKMVHRTIHGDLDLIDTPVWETLGTQPSTQVHSYSQVGEQYGKYALGQA